MALAVFKLWIPVFVAIGLSLPAYSEPASGLSDGGDLLVLTNAAQVLRLAPNQAKSNQPVRIHGIVTCYDHGNVLFVQDETAGVFVHYVGELLRAQPGQNVRVTGFAKMGRYTPVIVSESIALQGSGPAINPLPVSLAQIQHGGLDAQWVEVVGVVREENVIGSHLALELADSPHHVRLWIVDGRGYDRQRLSGSRVRVRGVVGSRVSPQGQLEGFQIYANSISDVAIIRRNPAVADPFASPRSQVRDLQRHGARMSEPGMVTIRGVVTFSQPGRGVFIQDSTGGLEVLAQSNQESLIPGDTVEVAGYPGPILEPAMLEGALIRKVLPPIAPQPVTALPADLLQRRYDNQLIEVTGLYLGLVNAPSNVISLAVQAGDHHLTALLDTLDLPKAVANLKPGCLLRLTGVCRSQDGLENLSAVALLLRSPMDIEVVSTPPLPRRIELVLLAGATLLSGLGLVAALWFIRSQRRRTEHVLQLHTALQAEMRQSDQQLRRSVDERERIGRDLHDDIIQSIYAAGLSLEDSRRVLRQSPDQAEARLGAAIHTLNNTILGVRSFIAGLEPKVLNGRELKTALKSLALTSGDGPTPFQFHVEPDAANILTSTQATQLLHIAKEAMSNSLRHAQASRVTVSLQATGEGIQLEIADDGVGFAPAAIATGQGLRNMATRARELGGTLRTISSPGQGCRILVLVPRRNAHEHD
jgi:signal transduction histidine kinase